MADHLHKAFRRFPNPGWAWPSGAHDQLISGAICPDRDLAIDASRQWLSRFEIDKVGFREHRLLAAVAHRFGRDLADVPQYSKLAELQRSLWRNSSMAVAETAPVLRMLAGASIQTMLIKGGARIAVRPDEQIARVSHDLDIVVRQDRFAEAIELLFESGWKSANGESRFRIADRCHSIRALNFFKGYFGDIDLHQWTYGYSSRVPDLENTLWNTASEAKFFGVPVLVPSPTDRIALAICHSGLEAHTHSDWLVDCAQLLSEGGVDWDRLADTLKSAKSEIPAQVALSYLNIRFGYELPSEFKAKVIGVRPHSTLTQISEILQAKPRTEWSSTTRLARGIAKQIGMARRVKPSGSAPTRHGRIVGDARRVGGIGAKAANRLCLQSFNNPSAARRQFALEIVVDLPGVRRTISFELNTDKRHLMKLRARCLTRRAGPTILRFSGTLDLHPEDSKIWLEARPLRHLRGDETQSFANRYLRIGAKVLSFDIR